MVFIPLHDDKALDNIGFHWVNITLILANVAIWLIGGAIVTGTNTATAVSFTYGFIPSVANDLKVLPAQYDLLPDYASYLTYAFFHADFWHLAGNMLFLWVFGDNVEDAMGHIRYLIFYLLCAAAAAYFHGFVFQTSDSPLIGASGAASGVVGAYLMLHPKVKVWVLVLSRIPLRLPALWLLGGWAAYQIIMFVVDSDGNVSWAAHVGGIVAGLVLVVVFKKRSVPLFDRDYVEPDATERTSRTTPKTTQPWGRQ
ncbi:MAG: rhomboid family intramembrane serine protease [Pseudomonadota bacterium]